MQHRHFLVKSAEGAYQLKEIDAVIARGISFFGIITGNCHAIESEYWTFYFMNIHIAEDQVNNLAQELAQQVLSNNRPTQQS